MFQTVSECAMQISCILLAQQQKGTALCWVVTNCVVT